MEFKPTAFGYQSINWSSEIARLWNHVNYIASTGDGTIKHYDSWSLYHIQEATQIFDWCAVNIQDEWAYSGGEFYFKNEKDAVLFALMWLGK